MTTIVARRSDYRFLSAILPAILLSLAVAVLVDTSHVASASAQTPGRWVALGDSFSSGEGTNDYDAGTNDEQINRCRRSHHAWPRVLANRLDGYALADKDHKACSGATTADIHAPKKHQFNSQRPCPSNAVELNRQSYPRAGTIYTCEATWEPAQTDALDDSVRLVTLTIGGNDVGFADIGKRCALEPVTEPIPGVGGCVGEAELDQIKTDSFSSKLRDAYKAVLNKATNAKVLVVGYPPVLYRDPCGMFTDESHDTLRLFVASLNVKAIHAVQDVQAENSDTARRLNYAGRLAFIPIKTFPAYSAWQDRGICYNASYPYRVGVAPNERINRINTRLSNYSYRNSFHPNFDGYRAIGNVVESFIEGQGGQGIDHLPPVGAGSGADTALVIDTSGSMGSNDPQNRRIEAGRTYLNSTLGSDYVGVVDFDDSVRVAQPMTQVGTGRNAILAALNSLDSSGGTDIGIGVQAACDELNRSPSGHLKKAAILFTDGQGSYSDQDRCFSGKGWPIFAFGLGDADDRLLQGIADRTGGEYKRLTSVNALACEFQRVRSKIAGTAVPPCEARTIKQGETITQLVSVPARQLLATFSIFWPGSDVELSLTTPSGLVVGRTDLLHDVRHENGSTFETYSVVRPEPGEWTLTLHGLSVDPDGEPVTIASSTIPNEFTVPVASYSASSPSGGAPQSISFDAFSSASANGRIVSWLWNFQDGTGLVSGPVVDHTFEHGGEFRPILTVTDEVGEEAVLEGPAILIEGPPAPPPPKMQLFPDKGSSSTDIKLSGTRCVPSHPVADSGNFVFVEATKEGATAPEVTTAVIPAEDGSWEAVFGIPGAGVTDPTNYAITATCHVDDQELFSYPPETFVLEGLRPVLTPFTIAGSTPTSAIYATGTPKNGTTEGTVYGIIRNQPIPITPITEAGLITIDGQEVLLVRFQAHGETWEVRYRSIFGIVGTVEICGPPGCESGLGVKYDNAGVPISGFGLPSADTTSSTTQATTTTTTPPTTVAPTTSSTAPSLTDRCEALRKEYNEASDSTVRSQLAVAMQALGCPPP